MFQLAELRHMVRIPPWHFGQNLNDAIVNELNKKLANKVVLNVGMCIVLYDLTSLEDSFIFPGDGGSHTRVSFRFLTFRPFIEEVLEGTVKAANADGIQVSLGFFDDVYIRSDNMMSPSHYDETEKTWIWDYEVEGETHNMFIDIGERIRVKVVAEQFTDTTPTGPDTIVGEDLVEKKEGKIPYLIYGSINDQGLGLVSWWASNEQEENEGEEEDDVKKIEEKEEQ
ncbi:unnamed protein product [Meganyctiphanes norvegica]|uniref:DNA-directed RNA polymerase III subunit RPC8 n=1 Tax=Meganyctiphanes norvegica TaxID=48144 RepID=A0AAV2Q5J9_MEGNR